jgi:DNA-binding SARP family transcriptional activator
LSDLGASTQVLPGAGDGAHAIEAEAFRLFPYGILVLDSDRRVLASNKVAEQLLANPLAGMTCCSVLGCRTPDSPLAESCFSELARSIGGTLPEVRVDLPRPGIVDAVWVTAAPLERESGHVVVQVRPGEADDRRRRTIPHWIAGPMLRIYALGRTRVESGEGSLGGKWLEGRPGQILKYLVTHRRQVVHSDDIAETIWPGSDIRAVNNVRYIVHALREKIEPHRPKRGPSSFVLSAQGGYTLNRERVWIDVDVFEARVRAGRIALADGDPASAEEALRDAIAVYGGDYLADEPYTQWALPERDRLRALASEALRLLVNMRLGAGDLEGAAPLMEQLAGTQPYDVDVHRQLIALALARGRHSDAVRQYAAFRTRMVRTFEAEPPFALSRVSGGEIRAPRLESQRGARRQRRGRG